MFKLRTRNSLIVLALIAGVSTLIAAQAPTRIRLRTSGVPPPAAPIITTTTLPNATVGVSYTACISATGGTPPYTWDKTVGVYPAGLSLVAGTGCFSGTPTTPETQVFTVRVTDNVSVTDTQELSITVTSTTCTTPLGNGESATVQAALNAAQAGQTICIPAGTWGWSTQVSWTAPANVALLGAGSLTTLGGGNATTITDNYGTNTSLLNIAINASGSFRLAGITFAQGSGIVKESAIVVINGSSQAVRIDHNRWNLRVGTPNASKVIRFIGPIRGVFDHNIIDAQTHGQIFIQGGNIGDDLWAAPTNFGTNEFVFIEDNLLTTRDNDAGANDCNAGGRYVIRYNTNQGLAMSQTHPTGGSGRGRGCRAHEVYGNTVTAWDGYVVGVDEPAYTFLWETSGPAMNWGNTITNYYKNFLVMQSMRRSNATYPESPTPDGWGYCGTEFTGTGSNWDQNTNSVSGYACLDDVGRGQGNLLSGLFPNAINTTTGTIAWPNQALEPLREWLNTVTLEPGWGGSMVSVADSSRIAANQNYYLYTASFTGATGNGSGTRAARPSTCTTGVAYWSTDQGGNWNTVSGGANDGTLDLCTATNTWTNGFYTPYTYPHPLVQ